jgi:hypothetical protein
VNTVIWNSLRALSGVHRKILPEIVNAEGHSHSLGRQICIPNTTFSAAHVYLRQNLAHCCRDLPLLRPVSCNTGDSLYAPVELLQGGSLEMRWQT